MATSGSFSTNHKAAPTRVWYWDFSWWVTGWNGNTASIHWQAVARCESGTSGKAYVANIGFGGRIAGYDIGNPGGNFYKDTWVASGDISLAGGTSFSANIWANPYSANYTSSGSGSWTLDNNVITPTVTVSLGAVTETTMAASMSVTHNGYQPIKDNYIDLFTDSGCTNKVGSIAGTSGIFNGLSPNTTYYARANASNGYYRGYSSAPSKATYAYPYCTSAPDFTIGNDVTVQFYNPLNRSIQIQMWSHNSQAFITPSKINASGTSYKFTASSILSALYSSIPAATSSKYNINVWYGTNKAIKEGGTYKVSGNNAQAPTFSNFDYQDVDSLAPLLTGKKGVNNPGVLISGMSDCQFSIPVSQKATSGYGATMDKYNFAWPNGAQASSSYSSSAAVTGKVLDGNTTKLSVSAYDKRGQYRTVEKTITLITPYHATSGVNTVRKSGVEATTYLAGNITYWSGDWASGSSRPNIVTKIEYRVNKTGSYYDITSAIKNNSTESISGKTATLTLKSNIIQLHANGSSGGFAVGTSYVVELFISTGVSSSVQYENRYKIAEITVTSGIFGMARFKDSSGKYHYGFNGLPSSNRTVKVNGTMESSGATYVGADGLYIRTELKLSGILN